tara:strand:+ start:67 stop:387 length:321 start_codon:yes stop_codon:yes gene_type:complete
MSISPEVMNWLVSISLLSGCLYATWLIYQTNKKPEVATNYKNIALMAQNLTACKVSTRKQVLTELYLDPNWSEEEVDELKSVLEGILKTKLTIDKPGQASKGIKTL